MGTLLRAFAVVLAALLLGGAVCEVLVRTDPSPADTGPVLRLAMWCVVVEVCALWAGTFLAARRGPASSYTIVVAAGTLAYMLLAVFLVVRSGMDRAAAEVTLMGAPVALLVCAFGGAVGRR